MQAAVYRGVNDVRMETVPVPQIGAGELLIRVHTCGICGTDLKKISTGSHSAPRIFGHETTGVIAQVGDNVTDYRIGDRVMVFHHIPCGDCYYCRHKVFAQCPTYKKVGATAGYEASGGGFSEYVRVMDWIVARNGVVRIPDGVSFEQASFIEPVNTCMKGIETLGLKPGEVVLVMGQGPIGIILAVLARRHGVRVITSDLLSQRHTIAKAFGLERKHRRFHLRYRSSHQRNYGGTGRRRRHSGSCGQQLDSHCHGRDASGRHGYCFLRKPSMARRPSTPPRFALMRRVCWGLTALLWICRKSRRDLFWVGRWTWSG